MDYKLSVPLTTSIDALFGNTSWFHDIMRYSANMSVDTRGQAISVIPPRPCAGMPFSQSSDTNGNHSQAPHYCDRIDYDIYKGDGYAQNNIVNIRWAWLENLIPSSGDLAGSRPMDKIETWLKISMFVANRGVMTTYADKSRTIYSASGELIRKPVVSLVAMIVLSTLLGLQLLGLTFLAYYMYQTPSCAAELDALTMARIGAALHQQGVLGAFGESSLDDAEALKDVNCVIGMRSEQLDAYSSSGKGQYATVRGGEVHDVEMQSFATKKPLATVDGEGSADLLGLGALGKIQRRSRGD